MKRKVLTFLTVALVAAIVGVSVGYAQCDVQQGGGSNSYCLSGPSCGGFLAVYCEKQYCAWTYPCSFNVFSNQNVQCAIGGCFNPFSNNCHGCANYGSVQKGAKHAAS